MALVNVPTVAASASSKQIVITPGSSTSILYTVPAGKAFVGSFVIYNTSYPQINGTYLLTISSWPSGQNPLNVPVTLVAGTTVQNGSSSYQSWTMIGTES